MKAGDRIKRFLFKGVRDGVYPGAVLLAGCKGEVVFFQAAGHSSLIPRTDQMQKGTIFDLASLTKPLATTLGIMRLIDQGSLDLDQTLADLLPGDVPAEKRAVTPRMCLCHSAGFVDWKAFYLELDNISPPRRKEVLRERILNMPAAYPPGSGTLYSDLGFMVLEWILEERAGCLMDLYLDQAFYVPLLLKKTFLNNNHVKSRFHEDRFAATEDCPWRKKIIRGTVHDENAYAMGGFSGHAGLFGTAEEVYALVDLLRQHYYGKRSDYFKTETVRTFFSRQNISDESGRALGWDTPSVESSSAGRYFSSNSFGHLGFTGTSVWMDLEKDVIVVFLTNRVHPTRKNEKIRLFRPQIHDVIMEELGEDK